MKPYNVDHFCNKFNIYETMENKGCAKPNELDLFKIEEDIEEMEKIWF
jgi:hypothetical protein